MSFHSSAAGRIGATSAVDENTRLDGNKPANAAPPARPRLALGDVTNIGSTAPLCGATTTSAAAQPAAASNRPRTRAAAAAALGGGGGAIRRGTAGGARRGGTGVSTTEVVDESGDVEMMTLDVDGGNGGGDSSAVATASDGSSVWLPQRPPTGVVDIDRPDTTDPLTVALYVQTIFEHFRSVESCKAANPRYIGYQTDINEKMRAILIDWLIEVHLKFKLMPETLYLTVNIIDRFLEIKMVARQKLQLVGVTAMLIASKYEEIYAPEVRDFVYITDRAYTREQILNMECAMLQSLNFSITTPTAYPFLKRFLKAAQGDTRLTQMSTYFTERTLQEYRMLQFLPSMISASAVNMALRTLGCGSWTTTLEHYTGYSEEQLRPCIQTMEHIVASAPSASLKAVYRKWSNPRFGSVARATLVPLTPSV